MHLQSPNIIQNSIAHQRFIERGNPPNPLPTLKHKVAEDLRGLSLPLNNQWPLKVYDIWH